MAKDPWEVVSVESYKQDDPWAVVSTEDYEEEPSFLGRVVDTAVDLARPLLSLTPAGRNLPKEQPIEPGSKGAITSAVESLFGETERRSVLEDYRPDDADISANQSQRLSYGAGPIRQDVAAAAAQVKEGRAKTSDPTVNRVAKTMAQRGDRTIGDLANAAENPANTWLADQQTADDFRSAGEMARDSALNFVSGVVTLAELPAAIIAPDSKFAADARSAQKFLRDQESDVLQANRRVMADRINNEEGFLDQYLATVAELLTNPTITIAESIKQVPMFLGILAASKAGSAIAGGGVALAERASPSLALGEAISGGAIRSAAQATGAAVGGRGAAIAMAGGDAASSTYQRLTDPKQTPKSVWEKSPDYQRLIAEGMSHKEAVNEIAVQKSRMAAAIAGPLGLLGFAGAEAALVAGMARRAVGSPAKVFAKELAGETAEEGGTQLAGNVAVNTVDPSQDLLQGVGEAAGMATVTSTPFAAVGAYSAARQGEQEQRVDPAIPDILRQEAGATFDGLIRPESTSIAAAAAEARRQSQDITPIASARSVDEAIAATQQVLQAGSDARTLTDAITPRPDQNAQLDATLAAIGETNDAGAVASVPPAQPTATAEGVAGAATTAATGQSEQQGSLSFPTAEAALRSLLDSGVNPAEVEIMKSGEDQFVLRPRGANLVEMDPQTFSSNVSAVANLRQALATSEGTAGNLQIVTPSTPLSEPAQTVVSQVEAFNSVLRQITGKEVVLVTGNNPFDGVSFAGRYYLNVSRLSGYKPDQMAAVVGATLFHEATHTELERSADPLVQQKYAALRDVIVQYQRDNALNRRLSFERRAAKQQNEQANQERAARGEPLIQFSEPSMADGTGEFVADVSGGMMVSDPEFWKRVYDLDNGSTLRRVGYKFMEYLSKLIGSMTKGTRFDVDALISQRDAVREALAQAWSARSGKTNLPSELTDPQFSLGVSAEVAPDPRNTALANRWDALKPDDKVRITQEVMNDLAPKVFSELGLQGWTVDYTTGSFEGKVNPSAIIRAAEGATVEQLGEAMRVFGYVLDQKGMVAFDESNTTSDSQAGFVKVVLPEGLTPERIDEIRQLVASQVPQAEGDTLRDGSLVFGNFSAYNDKIATLTDDEFYEAIATAMDGVPESTETAGPFRFHSEYDQAYWGDEQSDPYIPEGRRAYLERTRYANNTQEAESGRDGVRGRSGSDDARARIEGIAAEVDERIQQLIQAVSYSRSDAATGRPGSRNEESVGSEVRGAIHFGRQGGLTRLSGSSFGTGIKGAEQERLKEATDPRIKKRVYFYLPTGGGKQVPMPEIGLGVHVYSADLSGLYNVATATQNIRGTGNAFESAVLDAGYRGYVNPEQGTVVVLNQDVPVEYLGTADQFAKVKRTPTAAKPRVQTRTEGNELVRRPEGSELSQIAKLRDEVKFVAPSFRLEFGEARVLSSEAPLADQVLRDSGSSFQFGQPQFSRNGEFDSFNLDTNDFMDDVDVSEAEMDFDALQAELDAEMNRGRARAAARESISEPTDAQIKEAGLFAERAVEFGPHKTGVSNITLAPPDYLNVRQYEQYDIRNFGNGLFSPSTDLDGIATFISDGKRLSEQAAIQFTQNQLAADYLHKRGFDLASVYRKGTILKIAEGWTALAKKGNAFKFPGAQTKSTSFPEIAMAMGLFKDWKVTVEFDEVVEFQNRANGTSKQAILIERRDTMACCTMGLAGSDLGTPFYAVAGKLAENMGKRFVADTSLSVINTFRRTEQALSYALKTGNTGVVMPGPQNRVYGYNEKPQTQQDHYENIARLALANMRNVEEAIPEVRRWSYDPKTSRFVDSRGNSVEDKVEARLKERDVRAFGIGRTTLARAVLTSQLIKGDTQITDFDAFESPVLYSRVLTDENPQPLSESWGQLNADGTVEYTPEFANWFGDSKVVNPDGTPMVVYHGTAAKDFKKFSLSTSVEGGLFFTTDPNHAGRFAPDDTSGSRIIPVYLSFQDPLVVDGRTLPEEHDFEDIEALIEQAKDEGRDGIVIKGFRDYSDTEQDTYIALDPRQIKSVFNAGSFDAEKPNISFSRQLDMKAEEHMRGRNMTTPLVSANSVQMRDIANAMRVLEEQVGLMKAEYAKLSGQLDGDTLSRRVIEVGGKTPLGRVPHVLTMLRAPSQSFYIDPSIVYKIFVDKHAKEMEGISMKALVEGLYKPAMVLKGREEGAYELVLPIVTQTGPVFAPVKTNLRGTYVPDMRATAIMSMYPRKVALGGDSIYQRIKDGKLLYVSDLGDAVKVLTGSDARSSGITEEMAISTPTPPDERQAVNVFDKARAVKPVNPYYVGWNKEAYDLIVGLPRSSGGGGIVNRGIKTDLDLTRWIANNFRGDWNDAPSFSRNPNTGLNDEGWWTAGARRMQDSFRRVQDVQNEVVARGGVLNDLNDTYQAETLTYGRVQEKLADFRDLRVKPLMRRLESDGLTPDELALFAYAKHAPSRNAHIASINAGMPDGGSGMTNAEADAILKAFDKEGKTAKLETAHAELMSWNQMARQQMLDDGLISQEQFDAWEGMWENYVPLKTITEKSEDLIDDSQPVKRSGGRGFNIRGRETMRAMGRSTKAGQIIENVIKGYEQALERGERNRVAQVFYQFVLDNPDPALWEIDKRRTRASFDHYAGRVKLDFPIDKGPETVSVKLNGREVYISVKDPLLVRALRKDAKAETAKVEKVIAYTVGPLTSLLRNTFTRYNPEFAVVNTARDLGFGAAAMKDELGNEGAAKFLANVAGANGVYAAFLTNRDLARSQFPEWNKWLTEFRAAGATTGGFFMQDVETISGDIRDMMLEAGAAPTNWVERLKAGRVVGMPYRNAARALKVLEFAGSVSENGMRLAAYRAAREMGKTPAQAARIAKDLTTNFNRKGEWGQAINGLFLFYNAAIQGAERMYRMTKNPKMWPFFAGVIGGTIALTMLNAQMGGEDDDGELFWDKIPQHIKERNLIIMLPPGVEMVGAEKVGAKGRYISIPMQYGLNFFTVAGYSLADAARNMMDPTRGVTAGKAAVNMVATGLESMNPFGGSPDNEHAFAMALLPTAADIVYQFGVGVDGFGRPTSPETYGREDSMLMSENANARQQDRIFHNIARGVNRLTGGDEAAKGRADFAPGTYENLWRNMTGGTGKFLTDIYTLADVMVAPEGRELYAKDIPVFRRGYGELDTDNNQRLFYERRNEVRSAEEEDKRREELGGQTTDPRKLALLELQRDADRATKALSNIRKEEREVKSDDTLTAEEKNRRLLELRAEKGLATKDFLQAWNAQMESWANGDFD